MLAEAHIGRLICQCNIQYKTNTFMFSTSLLLFRDTDDYDAGGDGSDEGGDYHSEMQEALKEKKERTSLILSEFKKRKGQVSSNEETVLFLSTVLSTV